MTKQEIREMTVTPEMKQALADVAEAQERFWDALRAFEDLTGLSFESTHDYIDYSDPSDEQVRDVCEYFAEELDDEEEEED